MLKNHEFRVRLAKTNKDQEPIPVVERGPLLTEPEISLIKDFALKATLLIGGTFAALKVVDAACEITVAHATPKKK